MKCKLIGIIALVSCLISCSSTLQFHQTGKSSRDLDHDFTECQTKAGQAGISSNIGSEEFIIRCMNGIGWDWKPNWDNGHK